MIPRTIVNSTGTDVLCEHFVVEPVAAAIADVISSAVRQITDYDFSAIDRRTRPCVLHQTV